MEFKCDGVTIRCVNPEDLPFAKNNLVKLIIELAQNKMERENKKIQHQTSTS